MSTMQKHELNSLKKWYHILCKVYKDALQENQPKAGQRYPKIYQNICGFIFAAVTLFIMVIWLSGYEYCLDIFFSMTNTNATKKTQRVAKLAWFSLNFSPFDAENRRRKISCFNGTNFFGCDVFKPGWIVDNADAYLFHGPWLDKVPLPRDSETIWGLLHEETPYARAMFMYEDALNLFNFSATFSRHSDLPLPLRWMRNRGIITNRTYYLETSLKNSLLKNLAPIMYLQSDRHTYTERDAYVQKLMDYIAIDSYGTRLHNKELPGNLSIKLSKSTYLFHLYDEELMKFLAQYKFIIAIENAICNDYVTEKFWRAIELGVVPIYYGSPLIRDWLPNNKSAILLEDFPTPELLSRHLHYLLSNDTAYEEYLEHKTLGQITNQNPIKEAIARPYQLDLVEASDKFECFICEKLHDKDSRVNRVNMVTKKHFDCSLPTSALTLKVNPNSSMLGDIAEARIMLDELLKEVNNSSNRTLRSSESGFTSVEMFYRILAIEIVHA